MIRNEEENPSFCQGAVRELLVPSVGRVCEGGACWLLVPVLQAPLRVSSVTLKLVGSRSRVFGPPVKTSCPSNSMALCSQGDMGTQLFPGASPSLTPAIGQGLFHFLIVQAVDSGVGQ